MPVLAVGLTRFGVRPMSHRVKLIAGLRIPAQIAQAIVLTVAIVVTTNRSLRCGPNKCSQDKAMNKESRRFTIT